MKTDKSDVLVPVETLKMLPGLLFHAMAVVQAFEETGCSDADAAERLRLQRLASGLETARNEIGKLLGFRVSPED